MITLRALARFVLVVVAMTLSVASSSAAPARDGRMGAPCTSSRECDAPTLQCFLPYARSALVGPSAGMCTAACTSDADCRSANPASVCWQNICLEGCTSGGESGEIETDKCHGREDAACSRIDPIDGHSLTAAACTPRCTSDEACGPHLYCNPTTGWCDPLMHTADPPGTRCDVHAEGPTSCSGVCSGASCIEPCVLGTSSGCVATTAASRLGAACVWPLGGYGAGNLGGCGMLCDCSTDCLEGWVCEPADFRGRFDAAGLCILGAKPVDSPDCVARSAEGGALRNCAEGSVRACRTDSCLGTEDCLPNGEYSACHCLSSPDAGTAPPGDSGDGQESLFARDAGLDATSDRSRDGAVTAPSAAHARHFSGCGCHLGARGNDDSLGALMTAGIAATLCGRRRRGRRRSGLLRALALTSLLTGCAQVLAYPDVQAETSLAACSDGEDNDLDGKKDCADPGCSAHCAESTDLACHDGKDNDVDGNTDCEDPDCRAHCLENTDVTCHDGKDNDFDGARDCETEGCATFCVESTDATCHDGSDNDQNGKTDCEDSSCSAYCPEADDATCADQLDNDSDGKTDCDDPDCDGHCLEETLAYCNDGRDNDGDGLVDAADPRCWLLAPPEVKRCAESEGVEVAETFDVPLPELEPSEFSEWSRYGTWDSHGIPVSIFASAVHGGDRDDLAQAFTSNTTGAPTLADNLGGLVRTWQFSGSWQGFELSFEALAPEGTLLRVGIVPAELAPAFAPTLPGAESALFALTLDGAHDPPAMILDVDGTRATAPLPIQRLPCVGGVSFCAGDSNHVRVVLEKDGLHATLERPNGETAEVRGPVPNTLHLAPSRLVFWGGTTGEGQVGYLDDIHLHVTGERPCGVVAPQIPGRTCDFRESLLAFGQVVSLAKGAPAASAAGHGQHCAVVAASGVAGRSNPETLTAWSSEDGDDWVPASSPDAPPVTLPKNASLIGAGIAHDDDGFHVVVGYRKDQKVRLGFAAGSACGQWGTLAPGPELPGDMEAPSYVIDANQVAVYFTRPPTAKTRRTLWRIKREKSAPTFDDAEMLAELPSNVGSPVSVSRVGTRDLVLVHPTVQSSGDTGVGLLVGTTDGRSFSAIEPSPLLVIPKTVDNRAGSRAFDDEGALSAALEWNADGGFILYGGSAAAGLDVIATETHHFSVGTARMVPSGQPLPESRPAPPPSCGDGKCAAGEDCSLCPADCACDGPLLLADVLTADAGWQSLSAGPNGSAQGYLDFGLDTEHHTLNWAGGDDTWSVLPLATALTGDFELSFDLRVAYVDPNGVCSVSVGLGALPELQDSGLFAPHDGVFARFTYGSACYWQYWTTPAVTVSGQAFVGRTIDPSASCEADDVAVEAWRHMYVRREDDRVTVGSERDDACGFATEAVTYAGALPALPALLVGFDGGSCPQSGSGSIENIRLRALDASGTASTPPRRP